MKRTSIMKAAATLAVLGLSAIGADAQALPIGGPLNYGYVSMPLYPYGYNPSSFTLGSPMTIMSGSQPIGYTVAGISGWFLPPIVPPAVDYYNGFSPTLSDSHIYEQGYNGRYYEAPPTIVPENGPGSYGYNDESYGYNDGGTNPASGTVSAGIPPAAPTNPAAGAVSASPVAPRNPVRLIHRLYGRVEIQYRGNTANVDNITLSLLDRNRHVVTQAVRTEPPASATLTRYNTVRYYTVTVQFKDGTTRTFSGAVR